MVSTSATSSVFVHSCNVHPCNFLRHCPLLQCPSPFFTCAVNVHSCNFSQLYYSAANVADADSFRTKKLCTRFLREKSNDQFALWQIERKSAYYFRSSDFQSCIFSPAFSGPAFSGPAFSGPAFSTLEIWSLIFQSCRSLFDLSGPSLVPHFPLLHFQSTLTRKLLVDFFISHNWTIFTRCYGFVATSKYLLKVGVLGGKFSPKF